MKNIIYPGDIPDQETIVIPEGIEIIAEKAFEGYTRIREVTLPASVISIRSQAFAGTSIKKIEIPNGSSLRHIGSCAFVNCKYLHEIYIPAGVENLHDYSFSGCESLVAIRGCRGIVNVHDSAMRNCTSLHTLELGDRLRRVGDCGLHHTAVPELIFPDGFRYLGWWGASTSSHLQFVSIPSAADYGNYPFDDCGEYHEPFYTLVVEYRKPGSEPSKNGYAYCIQGSPSMFVQHWIYGGADQETAKDKALLHTTQSNYLNEVFHIEVAPVENRRLIIDGRRIATDTTRDGRGEAVWHTV